MLVGHYDGNQLTPEVGGRELGRYFIQSVAYEHSPENISFAVGNRLSLCLTQTRFGN